jgi:hypothetical protein
MEYTEQSFENVKTVEKVTKDFETILKRAVFSD